MMDQVNVIVKFYSDEPIENIASVIKYLPQKVIYLGHKENMITKNINNIKRFCAVECPSVELIFVEILRDDLNHGIEIISNIIREFPDVKFDLTGGSEFILIALGCISARMVLKKIRIDPLAGKEIRIVGSEAEAFDYKYDISVSDDITLHGGTLTNKTGNFSEWKFTDDFKKDIRTMWSICQKYRSQWNKHCATIDSYRRRATEPREGWVELPRTSIGEAINLVEDLREANLIKDFSATKKKIHFRFKNDMIRKVISKAGNILELHIYEVATREAGLFTDAVIGAHIDWDGEVHGMSNPGYDTMNEIDVILMKNVCPIFISCKSGKTNGTALHELETVSRKFGGKFAKKALVLARSLDSTTGSQYFKQRARDMKIWVIDDVFRMSDEQLLAKLMKI